VYCCLSDGSGSERVSRLDSTARVLRDAGATSTAIFGRFTDRELYRLLLDRRVDVFVALRDELAAILIDANVSSVAGDAMEGFNPGHDICRALIDGAVAVVRERTGRELENLQFAVDPDGPSEDEQVRVTLDDAALDRKLHAALGYPEMRDEVEKAIASSSQAAFATEVLHRGNARAAMEHFERVAPRYETYGANRVKEGRYGEVIRYREHVLPVLEALMESARDFLSTPSIARRA
jgi:hypothetical protein